MSYYESHEAFKAEKPARGSIALSAQTKVVVPQKKGKTCGFVVSAPGGKEWHLSGETERDEEEWIEMIRVRSQRHTCSYLLSCCIKWSEL